MNKNPFLDAIPECFISDEKIEEPFFPPPWNIDEHPEKTEGWIEFQREMRKDPEYYLRSLINE